jgi:hypothetical protein
MVNVPKHMVTVSMDTLQVLQNMIKIPNGMVEVYVDMVNVSLVMEHA